MEESAPIEGYDDYRITDKGRVLSFHKGGPCELKQQESSNGYLRVCLYRDGKGRWHRVHRLVLEAFEGPCPKGHQTRHLNGDKQDNRLENLQWGTRKQNMEDRRKHGKVCEKGESNNNSKISEQDVREIRAQWDSGGTTQTALAEKYGVTVSSIHLIVHRKTWKGIEPNQPR